MTPVRFKVLKHFLQGPRHNVRFGEVMKLFFAPSYKTKASRQIKEVRKEMEFKKIVFHERNLSMYYPASAPDSSLERVVCESFYNDNWHYYEISETRVEPHDIVVDCGAAEGLFALLVADRCKKVYAIEPLENFCQCLHKTFSGRDNVTVLQLGLSSQPGQATISENDIASSLSVGSGTIKVETLDNLFYAKGIPVSYIKIDVEGFDVEVIRGAEKIIKQNKPKIAVTTYHDAGHAAAISELLLSYCPDYQIKVKGIFQETGSPVMLHAW